MDSDADGMTNGAEFGDPDCTWTPGTAPKFSAGLSHQASVNHWMIQSVRNKLISWTAVLKASSVAASMRQVCFCAENNPKDPLIFHKIPPLFKPRYEKTGFLHMRKQRRRSAVQ